MNDNVISFKASNLLTLYYLCFAEYAYTLNVNEKSDIFSYGMVILELITGRRPTDLECEENNLVKWVSTNLEGEGLNHILDPKLDSSHREEMLKVLKIGLLCTDPLPINRPPMRRVVTMLLEVRMDCNSIIARRKGRMTPYDFEDSENVV